MFRIIRENIGYYFLEKKFAKVKRNSAFLNLRDAKTVAIVANIDTIEKYKVVSKFIGWLRQQGKTVFVLALVKNEELQKFFDRGTSILFLSKKNTTWYGKPRNVAYEEFIRKPFDILIDTSLTQIITMQYLVGLSQARFKVGKFYDSRSYADFMITLKSDDNLTYFIDQIKHYLTTINQ